MTGRKKSTIFGEIRPVDSVSKFNWQNSDGAYQAAIKNASSFAFKGFA